MNQNNVIQRPDPSNVTLRGTILERAKQLTEGDRNQTYGEPKPNLQCFADMINAYLECKTINEGEVGKLTATDASMILVLLKISRVAANPQHADNFVDMAAYSGIGGECAGVGIMQPPRMG